MEVVGLVASITQLISVTAKTIKYLNSVKDASEDRSKLLQETTSLLPLFVNLQGQVEAAKTDKSVQWTDGVRSLAIENGPLDQLRAALEQLAKRLKPKTGLKNVAHAFVWTFDKDYCEALLARIERAKSAINLALLGDTFALAQSIKADTASIGDIRQDVSTLTRDAANTQVKEDLRQRQEILHWLSPLNFFKSQQDTFARREEGTAGAGKSILASLVIDFLRARYTAQDTVGVAGVYCNFKERDSQSQENLLAACCAQLAPQTLPETLVNLYRKHSAENTRPNREEIFKAFESCIAQLRTTYLVIDALDECSEDVRDTFIEFFKTLQNQIRLLVTTRHIDEILREFRASPMVEIRASPSDLKKYIASRIESNRRLAGHVRHHASLTQDICDRVTTKADGMFLAAKLHLDSLSTKTSIKLLKKALDNLSTDLNVLYDEVLLRIESQNQDDRVLAEKALRWVAYTYRPLKVKALQEALAIEPGDLNFDIDAIPRIGLILDVCAGLLIYDEENKIVRLVHYTAQDYFDALASSKFDEAHVLIASDCVAYLNYDCFQDPQDFIDDKESETSDAGSESQDEHYLFHLYGYASSFWAQHAITKRDRNLSLQVSQFLARDPRVLMQTPSQYDDSPYEPYFSLLGGYKERLENRHGCEITAFYGLNDELEMFCGGIEEGQTLTHYLDSSLLIAVSNGQTKATEILLDHGADLDSTNQRGRTALHIASMEGHLDLVNLLLARGISIDARDSDDETPLLCAAWSSREDCILALLNHGANTHSKDYNSLTVLHWASMNGYLNIVNILLARDIDVDVQDRWRRIPLFYAVEQSHTDCTLALLDHGANLNSKDHSGSTVLHKAALSGDFDIVKILLARGAESELGDEWGRTPLLVAAKRCHTSCVLALTGQGADVDAQDNNGFTPLHLASARGNTKTTLELLKHYAAVDRRSESMYGLNYYKQEWLAVRYDSVLEVDLNEELGFCMFPASTFNKPWNLREVLQSRDVILEILVWKDGLTALELAMLGKYEEMIHALKPLTTSTGEPVPLSIEVYLFELLGVASVEEAEEELDRRIFAEEEAEKEAERAEKEAKQEVWESTEEEVEEEEEK
ncbi:MAG: hypothetical protein L6R42_005724 [Xanthoria sp. 1 TBL-2021]|nr:MAG: hypothetical protein L6R42_005724 [Xanthoria sp. 1 TBL-2021]